MSTKSIFALTDNSLRYSSVRRVSLLKFIHFQQHGHLIFCSLFIYLKYIDYNYTCLNKITMHTSIARDYSIIRLVLCTIDRTIQTYNE